MKNDQIAALLADIRTLKEKVEVRDHQLVDLAAARDRALDESRKKGEVITCLDDVVRSLCNELATANTWLEWERVAHAAVESSLEQERRLLVEARDQLEQEQSAREASESRAREQEMVLE
ncbi:hypothetical protein KFY46_26100, partial [Salmonella enterica subsp. enterica serovar 1,4,[5],12:i:-]|nr:hypothetical protein [Salmonella enterica subsp. enterica serovar 1,4,[5],12:i:-]